MNDFVISDIHGMYKQFEELLTYWNPEDKLVLLGDLVDRGPQSLKVLQKAMALKATYKDQVILCKGNHDKLFLDFIDSLLYLPIGGRQTMMSFIEDAPKEIKELNSIGHAYYLRKHFAEELAFLKRGKLYPELGSKFRINIKHTEQDSSSTHMDCEFIYNNNEYIRAEAKAFPDPRNSSQKFLLVFGGILKGRTLPLAYSSNNLPVKYALIIDKAHLEKFGNYKKDVISGNDWETFGKSFNAKYIFTVDKINNTIQKLNWSSI